MKLLKKLLLASIITMVALIATPKMMPGMQVNAASVKISSTKKTMYKGYTYKLKVTGTSKKVTWSSSDKSKATVNSKGKVYVKKNGKVTITAKVGDKKLKCKVTIKNKPFKYIQFNNEAFYNLKDVAKEYRYAGDIKNYKDFNYDLDGDGKKDKITIKKGEDDLGNTETTYLLNGKQFYDYRGDMTEIFIMDLNKNDNTMEVVIWDDGPSDDPIYTIWSKKGSKMKNIAGIYRATNFKISKKGKIIVDDYITDSISPKVFRGYYTLKNGKIKYKKLDMKNIKNQKFNGTYLNYTSDMKNLEKFFKYEEENISYEKAMKKAKVYTNKTLKKFKILKIYSDGKIYTKLSNGKNVYLFPINGFLAG